MVLIILVVGLNHCLLITREVFQSYMQKYERLDFVAVSQVFAGVVSLVALGLTVYFTGELLYGVIAMLFARLLVFSTWGQLRGAEGAPHRP